MNVSRGSRLPWFLDIWVCKLIIFFWAMDCCCHWSRVIRGSHTFSIPALIIGEVPRASLPLVAHIWRSSHSLRISRSRSPPSTLENWAWRSFLEEVFILRLMEFTLYVANSRCVGFYCVFCVVVVYPPSTSL